MHHKITYSNLVILSNSLTTSPYVNEVGKTFLSNGSFWSPHSDFQVCVQNGIDRIFGTKKNKENNTYKKGKNLANT